MRCYPPISALVANNRLESSQYLLRYSGHPNLTIEGVSDARGQALSGKQAPGSHGFGAPARNTLPGPSGSHT